MNTAVEKIHYDNFLELIERDNTREGDVERLALFYIFAHKQIIPKINGIYDFNKHEIKPDCFTKIDFSGGVRSMVELAFNLYNDFPCETPVNLFSNLDEDSFDICLRAIRIRFNKI